MPVGPINRVEIDILMFSNEDFYLRLPFEAIMGEGADITDVVPHCKLVAGSTKEIDFAEPDEVFVEETDGVAGITLFKHGPFEVGKYVGDVRLTFPGDFDVVSHTFNVNVKKGEA